MKIKVFLKNHWQVVLFSSLALVIILVGIFAPQLAPKDSFAANMLDSLHPPSDTYPLGTDKLGRDLLSRIIYATRLSLFMALLLVALIFFIGTSLGVLAGYFGGLLDKVIMRLADMMISFPGLILAIAIAGILGPSHKNAVLAITAVSWPKYARFSRALVLQLKDRVFVEAARLNGGSSMHILWVHILPNMIEAMIVTAATDIGAMILELSALSFLGFGAKAPRPEWGVMLNEGRQYLAKAPWLMLYPGIAILVVVVVFNLLGDAIRDELDPYQEKNGGREGYDL